MRKRFHSEFMTKVVLEAIKGEKTIAELSSEYEVHNRTQIVNWRKRA
ncbi:MAG: transposase [Candidatus Jettenia sp. AMX1]|nr:MAG: transposase [Candidatus Jettenia sp. AMX1]MCE7880037.1 transposase [Candidatus Jettenia sp. AMX1]WKZ14771.1 MAG: transposase [Candidatus Jettenia caeni]